MVRSAGRKVHVVTTSEGLRSIAGRNLSAVDLVTAEIRRAVLTGALPPGEEFSIRELARQLGVSHIPIREALRRLEGQGLVVLRQARSAVVAPLSVDDLHAVYRLRLRIEPDLAGRATDRRTAEQLAQLRAALERSRDGDPDRAWQGHYDFHELLVSPAASPWDGRLLHTLWTAAERYTLLVFDPILIDERERGNRYERHRRLYDRAAEGDGAGVERELTAHLQTNETEIAHRIRTIDHPADAAAGRSTRWQRDGGPSRQASEPSPSSS